MCLNRFYRGKVQKLSTMTLSVDVTALVTSTDIKCFIRLTTNGGYTNWLLKCFKSWLISGFPYSSICDILTLLKKVVNFNFGVIKFFCRYMYICTYQDWLFWLITNIFFTGKGNLLGSRTSNQNCNKDTHLSPVLFFLSFFFFLTTVLSFFVFPAFLAGFFLVLFPLASLASLSWSAISTAFFLLPLLLVLALPLLFFDLLPELASLPRSLSSSTILDFLSPWEKQKQIRADFKN